MTDYMVKTDRQSKRTTVREWISPDTARNEHSDLRIENGGDSFYSNYDKSQNDRYKSYNNYVKADIPLVLNQPLNTKDDEIDEPSSVDDTNMEPAPRKTVHFMSR